MIQSKLTEAGRLITANKFPQAAVMGALPAAGLRTTYCDNDYMRCRVDENRVGHFMLLEQRAQCFADCEFEVRRTGVPVLMMSLAKHSAMSRVSAGQERYWHTGDVCLSLTASEDVVINRCVAGSSFNLFNIVVPQPMLNGLAERHPDAFENFILDLERGETRHYTREGLKATRTLASAFHAVDHSTEMGNYAETYIESKILDCLSMLLNRAKGSDDALLPVNLVLSDKMRDARNIIMSHYQCPPSLHRLATMVGTNECTLKAAFKREFNMTVFQFLFEYRMAMAERYLLDTDLSIAEVGMMLGYDHQSHFSTAFRRRYGISPTAFRCAAR